MKKTAYITTPIYYPSGNLHIGHVYTTTLASTLANYKKMFGYDVKMLTGADEHGQKIEAKANELNMTPQKYVDGMSVQFKYLWKKLEINYDYYSRTTNPKHEKAVASQFSELLKKEIIYKGNYKGLYSVSDEEFFTPTQAKKENGKFLHPTSGHELVEIKEESYFFKMSNFNDWLIEYIKKHPGFISPNKIITELSKNFLNKGLEDLSITRSSFTWGINVVEDPKHVMYVWLDALNNYITALGYKSDDDKDFKKYWENGDEIIHIVGKEITRFHGIYWPIILHASGLRQPTKILSHGWIVTPEGKMSKSKGNVIDPIRLIDTYGPEVVKYFFASQINMGQDGTFEEERFKDVYNADLANNFGNLLSRTISMTKQNFSGSIKFTKTKNKDDVVIIKDISLHFDEYKKLFDNFQINKALNKAIKLSKKLNGFIDITKPWTLKGDKKRLEIILNILLNGIYAVGTMLSVVMPNKMSNALKQIGFDSIDITLINDFKKFDDIVLEKNIILFERIK